MSYVDDIRERNESQLDRAIEAIDGAASAAPPLVRQGLQQWVDRQGFGLGVLVPDGWVDEAADYVIAAVDEVLDYCRDSVGLMREANRYLGSPDTLRAVASALGELAAKADGIQITKSTMPGLVSWDDPPASNTYSFAIDDQEEPLNRVSSTASAIAGAIDQHANDIENYYMQLATAIIGAVVTIIGVVSAILGIVGALPTGGLSLVGSILGAVTAVLGIATTVIGIVQMVLASTQGTRAKLDGLPGEITEWEVPGFAQVA
ncbi:hypothetical protein NQ156_14880 [Microbacterium sp. zg.Y625]|uniref:hypothetical protein n=1 Tax=Microbacterium jiangjiandongii TaxID=3049071 RepID=UPI00214B9FAF|nr:MULTISPECIES: hypothetical protein [unclassified Microbacterium]MCR2794351.1 hypothetical protein [Microbacterium sp. zg.Y625]MCR2816335.1 hypothetical protein [Microbacterium sp. zg.Y843]WIM25602.1 hypothetical protein QNO14_00690 [Microbacterium sp. zg-Y625]